VCAFTHSFAFVLAGGPHFDWLRRDQRVQAFLTGAGATAIGAIAGSAVPLSRALAHPWQAGILAAALIWLIALGCGVVPVLVGAAIIGIISAIARAPS
jgi:chromate transporter